MKQNKELTWTQAIEKTIIELGYIATLKQIYLVAPKYKTFEGLTPHKTINERVQRDENFVKIRPGLYGLKNYLDKLPDEYNPNVKKSTEEENIITHSHIQGMLLEIGNFKGFKTFSPDKSGLFVNKKLSEIITQPDVPKFTFDNIIQSTKYIDVIWFNDRQFPNSVFEVENSTNFRNSLVKFVELQDFITTMTLIAPKETSKINKYQQEIEKSAF
ncbi:MAG: hypothetical protein LBI18_09500, partial [Planctomycetaceae bacterium]|nr:hypothetical protein [Planctomycetaceae bacterium]